MKQIQLIVAALMLVFIGCADQSTVVGPAQTPELTSGSSAVAATVKPSLSVVNGGSTVPNTNILSASQRIQASAGGSVRLAGSYTDTYGDVVSYDVSIAFIAGALPADTTISLSIDKATFQEDGTVTFGPCGLVFKTPGTLSMMANNITFAKNAKTVHLYYLVNGAMQQMPDSWGGWVKKSNWNLIAGASIPHFSRYAFGR